MNTPKKPGGRGRPRRFAPGEPTTSLGNVALPTAERDTVLARAVEMYCGTGRYDYGNEDAQGNRKFNFSLWVRDQVRTGVGLAPLTDVAGVPDALQPRTGCNTKPPVTTALVRSTSNRLHELVTGGARATALRPVLDELAKRAVLESESRAAKREKALQVRLRRLEAELERSRSSVARLEGKLESRDRAA